MLLRVDVPSASGVVFGEQAARKIAKDMASLPDAKRVWYDATERAVLAELFLDSGPASKAFGAGRFVS